jgi:small conductance mechanosensitive channel
MDIRRIAIEWYEDVVRFLPNLLLIAVILLLTISISHRSQGFVRQVAERSQAPREIGDLLARIARITILLVGVLIVLGQLGLSSAVLSFVAGLGIAGIVIGFALQDIVKHFAAGVLLLMLRPFRIGDQIQVSGFEGRVQDVQLRATVLKTENGNEVLIPNADVYNSAVVNFSRYDLRRQTITLKVPEQLDLARVRAALAQALLEVPGVAANPTPSVVATSLDGSVVTIEARFWVDERAADPATATTGVIAVARRVFDQARTS